MTIQFRRGTREQARAANEVLAPGRPGFETDTGRLAVGDGATPWTGLDPLAHHSELGPLAGLVHGRRRLGRLEQAFVTGGSTVTLLQASGRGTVTSIWMALGFHPSPMDLILQVTVDGEANPAFEVDLGTILAAHFGPEGVYFCANAAVQARDDGAIGFTFAVPMPFEDGIHVELVNATANLVVAYAEVAWTDQKPIPYRLRGNGAPRVSPVVVGPDQTLEYAMVLGEGWLVWHGLSVEATDGSYIERDHELYIDGEETPSWASTGTEDWFFGAFSFGGHQNYGDPFHMVGVNEAGPPDRLSAVVDLLRAHGGIRFEQSLLFVLGTETGVTATSSVACAALYYVRAG